MKKLSMIGVLITLTLLVVIVTVRFANDPHETMEGMNTTPDSNYTAVDSMGTTIANTNSPFVIEGMESIAANEYIALYVNRDNAEIAIRDMASGEVWYSNPVDREQDPIAGVENKSKMSAQMTITYENNKLQQFNMNSYSDSVMHKQVEVKNIPNGVKVFYTFGKVEVGLEALPKAISKERYERIILGNVEKSAERYLTRCYKLSEDGKTYTRIDVALAGLVLNKVIAAFESVGYTADDLEVDNKENGSDVEASENKIFQVSIEYTVVGDQLVVKVPTEDIVYPESLPIVHLTVLDYFGAGGTEDEGYIFVPDGSGSLIYLNNNKVNSDAYYGEIYGSNEVKVQTIATNSDSNEVSRLPVYGMKKNNNAFLAIIEQGDSVATIRADISGKLFSYNYVYPQFELIAQDAIRIAAKTSTIEIPVYQSNKMSTDFVIRYAFLHGASANYSGMAQYYQKYLVEQGVLHKLDDEDNLPFFLELVGNIPKHETFLGIPYESMKPLTTFNQARQIMEELQRGNINNIKLRYLGWFNGGINHDIPTHISPDQQLGGSKGLRKLLDYVQREGIRVYPDVSFIHVYNNSWAFRPSKDAARYLNSKPALVYAINPATLMRDTYSKKTSYYLLSNHRLPEYVNGFLDEYNEWNIGGVSLRNLGNHLNSDFRKDGLIDRPEAKRIVQEQLEVLHEAPLDIMVLGGNSYVLPYVDHIIEAPMSDSRYTITDESIPFYQIVLHGYVNYAGLSVNLSPSYDVQTYLLKALETGANLHFTWTFAPSSELKGTSFNDLYSVNYEYWMEQAISMYSELTAVLQDVKNKAIIDHQKLADQVYQVTYEGGKKVIVNYNDNDVEIQGLKIKGNNYAVVGGKT